VHKETKTSKFSYWDKGIALFCVAILLVPLLTKIPNSKAALEKEEGGLVVLFIEESLFQHSQKQDISSLSGKIFRYAQDIQNTLPHTSTLLLPVPSGVSSGGMFSLLEKLYLEGYHKENDFFRLTGVVLIGDIPFPIIRTATTDGSSVFPLTDFEDPAFLWDEVSGVFRENEEYSFLKSEIFHGVIRAPNNEEKTEEQWLSGFFDKNHEFHSQGFQVVDQALFFADMIQEAESLHPMFKNMHESIRSDFFSDLALLRYNQTLTDDVSALFERNSKSSVDPSELPEETKEKVEDALSSFSEIPLPDSLSYQHIRQMLPEFIHIAQSYISQADEKVRGTGRYSFQEETADSFPHLITKTDVFSREFLRNFSLSFEEDIVQYIEENWQKPVRVMDGFSWGDDTDLYFHGKKVRDITNAEECSLYRGSKTNQTRDFSDNSQLVSLNHLWNKQPNDEEWVYEDECNIYGKCCIQYAMEPEQCDPDKAKKDVFDYQGGKEENDAAEPTYKDCLRITNYRGVPLSLSDIHDAHNFSGKTWNTGRSGKQSDGGFWRPKYLFRRISSVIVKNEPRPETISKALENIVSGAIPADEARRVVFQGPEDDVVILLFPDIFSLSASKMERNEQILQRVKNTYQKTEQTIRAGMMRSNVYSYVNYLAVRKYGIQYNGSQLVRKISLEDMNELKQEVKIVLLNAFPHASTEEEAWLFLANSVDPFSEKGREVLRDITSACLRWLDFFGKFGTEREPFWSEGSVDIPSLEVFLHNDGETLIRYYRYMKSRVSKKYFRQEMHFPVVSLPLENFLVGENASRIDELGGEALAELLRWRWLTSDEKHLKVLQMYYGENTHPYFSGREEGYELAAFRAEGNADEIWWKSQNSSYITGEDSEWDEAVENSYSDNPFDDPNHTEDEEEEDPCTGKKYSKGVSVLEWLPAFQCWLQNTLEKPVEVEISNQCNYTSILTFDDEETYEDIMDIEKVEIPADSTISLRSSAGTQIPIGTKTDILFSFRDSTGTPISGGINFQVISEGIEFDSGAFEVSDTTYTGDVSLLGTLVSSPASITIKADGFPKKILHFTSIDSGGMLLKKEESEEENPSFQRISVILQNELGEVLSDFNAVATAHVSDAFLATLTSSHISIENGVGSVSLYLKSNAAVTLTVTIPGFPKGSIPLSGESETLTATRLLIRDVPEVIGFGETADISVISVDGNGQEHPLPSDTVVTVTENTKNILEIFPKGGGIFTLVPKSEVGEARIIAKSDSLFSDTTEVHVVQKITRENFRNIKPNALVSSFFGSDFANFSHDGDPLANAILFSGKTQAVVSSLNKNVTLSPRVSVNREGAVQVLDQSLQVSPSSLSPLKLQIVDTHRSVSLSEFSLTFPDGAFLEVQEKNISSSDLPGIFFESLDDSFPLTTEEEGNALHIFSEGLKILSFFSDGSFEVFDHQFSLQFEVNSELPIFSFISGDGSVIGRFTLFGAVMTPLKLPATGTSFFPIIGNSNGSLGFSLVGEGVENLLPSGGRGMEESMFTFASGFNEDDNFALQLGAGNTVGDSAKMVFGPSGIVLGDPTISFTTDQKLVSGFNRGIGKEIYRSGTEKHDFTVFFQRKEREYPDILLASKTGEVRMIKNFGNLHFRDVRGILTHADGILHIASADIDNDQWDDILILDSEGKMLAYKYVDGHVERHLGFSFPENPLRTIQMKDFDHDSNIDILAYEQTGDISIYWGGVGGFLESRKTILGAFGPRVDASNLALENTMVSMPSISQRGIDIYPLLLGNNSGEEEGIETLHEYSDEQNILENEDSWKVLGELQNGYPEGFSQDFSQTSPSLSQKIGLFAEISDIPELVVELFAQDENRGILQKGDTIRFTLRVQNISENSLHFSLAHVLNSAFSINDGSVEIPGDWATGRSIPFVQRLDSDRIHIVDIHLNPKESSEMYFFGSMRGETSLTINIQEDLEILPKYAKDGSPDVSVIVDGVDGVLHYMSIGHRKFEKYFESFEAEELPDFLEEMEDADEDGIPDKFSEDEDGNGIPDFSEDELSPFRSDVDEDGIPDVWDSSYGDHDEDGSDWRSMLGGIGEVSDEVMSYTACDGGCLNIPINFAFLVPGEINVFEALVASVQGALGNNPEGAGGVTFGENLQQFSPGIANAVSGASSSISNAASGLLEKLGIVRKAQGKSAGKIPKGCPVFGLTGSPPYVCSCYACDDNSYFRFYLSPTLTGGVGIGLCTGPASMGRCMAFAPAQLNWACNDEKYSGKKKKYTFSAEYGSRTGKSCSIVGNKKSFSKAEKDTKKGLKGLLFDLDSIGSFSVSYQTGKNKRVMIFPWNWLYEQMAEFQAMLTKLPSITIYYPDFSVFSVKEFADTSSSKAKYAKQELQKIGKETSDTGGEIKEGIEKTFEVFLPKEEVENMSDEEKKKKTQENLDKAAKETRKFKENIETTIGKFDDIYAALNEIPIVQFEPIEFPVKVPHLSRHHILSLMEDFDVWLENAEDEVQRAKQAWGHCSESAPIEEFEECQKVKAVTEKILLDSDSLIAAVRDNRLILESYLGSGNTIANIDMMAAQWLSQVICFLDTTILYLADWYTKNKIRLEMWIELFYLLEEIKEQWKGIMDIFIDYEKYCSSCKVNRGESVLGVFDIVMNMGLSPPIIRFPRLPDIVIDFSKIKGSITIPVPKPRVHFVPIIFPKLPPLELLGPPLWEISLPGIPQLPKLLAVPPLPPFPPTPKITLPDLPPVPLLPDIPQEISSILSFAKSALFLYCLFSGGRMPISEPDSLKSVIEGLTARPALRMFRFDFTGALFEDYVIPSVRRIEISLETNLDMTVGDSLLTAMESAFEPWNDLTTDLRVEQKKQASQFHMMIREMGISLDLDLGKKIDLEEVFSYLSSEQKNILQHQLLFADSNINDQKMYTPAQLRSKMGNFPLRFSQEFSAVGELKRLRSNIVLLQEEMAQRAEYISDVKDPLEIGEIISKESALANSVYNASVSAGFPKIRSLEKNEQIIDTKKNSFFIQKVVASSEKEKNIQKQHLEPLHLLAANTFLASKKNPSFTQEKTLNELKNNSSIVPGILRKKQHRGKFLTLNNIFTQNRDSSHGKNVSFLLPNSENTNIVQGEETIDTSGVYAQCEDGGIISGEKVISNDSFSEELQSILLQDLDGDGDEEMVLTNTYSVFIKENFSTEHILETLSEDPEIGAFVDFLPVSEAVKNITFRTGTFCDNDNSSSPKERMYVKLRFSNRFDSNLLGIQIIARNKANDVFTVHSEDEIGLRYTTLLLPTKYVPVENDPENFVRNREVWVEDKLFTGNILVQEFTQEQVRIPLFPGVQWNIGVREIRTNGFSTSSEVHLAVEKSLSDILNPQEPSSCDLTEEELEWGLKSFPAEEGNIIPNSTKNIHHKKLEEEEILSEIIPNSFRDDKEFSVRPGNEFIRVRATDSRGYFTKEERYTLVRPPGIILSKDALSKGNIHGYTNPRVPGVPFIVLRERDGKLKKLITSSANKSEKYITDEFGDYSITDFSHESGIALWNGKNERLAYLDAFGEKLHLLSPSIQLVFTRSGGGAITYKETGRVLAEIFKRTDGNSDVLLEKGEIFSQDLSSLLPGVYLSDRIPENTVQAFGFPGDAPSLPGGAAIVQGENIIALFSVFGEVKILDSSFHFQRKLSHSLEDPFLLELVDGNGRPQFDFFIRTERKEGDILKSFDSKQKFYTPKYFFSPLPKKSEFSDTRNTSLFSPFSLVHQFSDISLPDLLKEYKDILSIFPFPDSPQIEENDVCPNIPEDKDGIDDFDGCPEFDVFTSRFRLGGTYVVRGYSENSFPYLDFISDVRSGDKIFTAISSDDNSKIYSQSNIIEVPSTFVPQK
jgi:hypothetical protein